MRKIPCGRTERNSNYCCLRKHSRFNVKVSCYCIKKVNGHFTHSYEICCRKCGTTVLISAGPGIGLLNLFKVRFLDLYSAI